jgi:tRNA pseudouridine55 synthase
VEGLLVVDKPVGPSSHDVVARVRKATGERRIGHTGTLDPGASGVLPLVLGRATRLARFLSAADKTYEATIVLGVETDTYDSAGRPLEPGYQGALPEWPRIDRELDAFRGTFEQQPPAFSAKKIGGRRSYRLARAQRRDPVDSDTPAVVPSPVTVATYELAILRVDGPRLQLRIDCSSGFYVRSLAHDLGDRLGIGAHLAALRRTRSGTLSLADAVSLDVIERDRSAAEAALVPPERMLPAFPSVRLTPQGVSRARHGQELEQGDWAEPSPEVAGAKTPPDGERLFRLLNPAGDLVGLARPGRRPGLLHPSIVLV